MRRRPPRLASICRASRAMVCDDGLHASSPSHRRKSLRRLASTRGFKPRIANESGWIRVFEGLEPFAIDAPSKLVKVSLSTTVEDLNKQLGFGDDLTIWQQIGGDNTRRLEPDEYPLRIQEQFLATYGWSSAARRVRLAVDPELRHSLRWCAGPAARSGGVLRSGTLHVLKGHVFPQWKPRPAYIIASRLHTYGMYVLQRIFCFRYSTCLISTILCIFSFNRDVMGSNGVEQWHIGTVSTQGAEIGDMRKTPLSRQHRAGGRWHASSLSWLQHCLGEKYVVLLA